MPPTSTGETREPTSTELSLVANHKLEEVRSSSRSAAQAMYEAGPGSKRQSDVLELPEEHPIRKRARKTESAYISRYNAKVYTELLLAHLAAAEKEVVELKARHTHLAEENEKLVWSTVFTENQVLKRQIASLTRAEPQPSSGGEGPSESATVRRESTPLSRENKRANSETRSVPGTIASLQVDQPETNPDNRCEQGASETSSTTTGTNRALDLDSKANPTSPVSQLGSSECGCEHGGKRATSDESFCQYFEEHVLMPERSSQICSFLV